MRRGQGKSSPLMSAEMAAERLEAIDELLQNSDRQLTLGQREAIALVATSPDRVLGWQGVAGAGKTTALSEVKQMLEAGGYEIRGIAPSAQAATVLGKELGIDTCTVDRLLLSELELGNKLQLWIVDEAGMLGAQNAYRLLQKAEGVGARVLLTGDTRQLSAVAAGNPFASLQRSGMATAQMVQSKRQRQPELAESVHLAASGQPQAALRCLQAADRLQVHADIDVLREQVAREYLSLSPVDRETTLVVVGTNEERAS